MKTQLRNRRVTDRMTDLDIAPAYRTQANLWKAKYFEAYQELVKANKGIRRLRRKIDRFQSKSEEKKD